MGESWLRGGTEKGPPICRRTIMRRKEFAGRGPRRGIGERERVFVWKKSSSSGRLTSEREGRNHVPIQGSREKERAFCEKGTL